MAGHKIAHDDRVKKIMFLAASLITVASLVVDLFKTGEFVKDCIFIIAAIGLFYIIEKGHHLKPCIIAVAMAPFMVHLAGIILGFFSLNILGIGFDKYAHLISSASVTTVAFYWLMNNSKKHYVRKAFVALMIAQGFGALNEVNEFIGYHYLHIYGATLFSTGDGLPVTASDLQVYDGQWDMIFNLIGASMTVLILTIKESWNRGHKQKFLKL